MSIKTPVKALSINPDDAAMLLIDHQSGLFNLVKDIETTELRSRVRALAKVAKLAKLPLISTTSVPTGPNGPLIPEIAEEYPVDGKNHQYFPRDGEINAWSLQSWNDAVVGLNKKTLIIAGTLTEVCLAFPSITAVKHGFEVYAVVDASGSWNDPTLAIERMTQAGVILVDTFALVAELMQTHKRPDVLDWYDAMCLFCPKYKLLIESYYGAQQALKDSEKK